MHVLAPNGNLMFSTPSLRELTGWTPDEVLGKPIADFIHADDIEGFTRDFQNSLRDGHDLTLYYRFRMKDDRYIIFEITGHPYYAEENGQQKCKCFFAMGRPYPSKNTAMLDSFLELKIENERLRQELHGMYHELEEQGDYSSGELEGKLGFFLIGRFGSMRRDLIVNLPTDGLTSCRLPDRRYSVTSQSDPSPQFDRSYAPQGAGGRAGAQNNYSHPAPAAKKAGGSRGSPNYGALGIGMTGLKGDAGHQPTEKKKKVWRLTLLICESLC